MVRILDNRDELQPSLEEAKAAVEIARANLAKVKAGAKEGEINAQQANIAGLEAEQGTEITVHKATIAGLEAEQGTEIRVHKATIA